uniref:Uncharacterized protein n=1 Tax=Rhizophora mucronata TaxID=61149 RepID=A0A2P2NFX9_RHIMU
MEFYTINGEYKRLGKKVGGGKGEPLPWLSFFFPPLMERNCCTICCIMEQK